MRTVELELVREDAQVKQDLPVRFEVLSSVEQRAYPIEMPAIRAA